MATRLQNKRRIKAIIFNFLVGIGSYVLVIVGLVAGYVPSGKIIKYDNISAQEKPINYWITILALFLIGSVFTALALLALRRYRSGNNVMSQETNF